MKLIYDFPKWNYSKLVSIIRLEYISFSSIVIKIHSPNSQVILEEGLSLLGRGGRVMTPPITWNICSFLYYRWLGHCSKGPGVETQKDKKFNTDYCIKILGSMSNWVN